MSPGKRSGNPADGWSVVVLVSLQAHFVSKVLIQQPGSGRTSAPAPGSGYGPGGTIQGKEGRNRGHRSAVGAALSGSGGCQEGDRLFVPGGGPGAGVVRAPGGHWQLPAGAGLAEGAGGRRARTGGADLDEAGPDLSHCLRLPAGTPGLRGGLCPLAAGWRDSTGRPAAGTPCSQGVMAQSANSGSDDGLGHNLSHGDRPTLQWAVRVKPGDGGRARRGPKLGSARGRAQVHFPTAGRCPVE